MAAATTIMAGVAIAGTAAKTAHDISQRNKAEKAIAEYDRQDLDETNPYEDLQVSTLGSDLLREEAQRSLATIMDNVTMGGTRAILGNVGKLASANNRVNREIGIGLDRQQKEIDRMSAAYDDKIVGMKENRENADLAGLGANLDYYKNQTVQDMNALMQGAFSLTNQISANNNQGINTEGDDFFGSFDIKPNS